MEKLPALLLLLVCVAMLARMALPWRTRRRVDAAAHQAWAALRRLPQWRQRKHHLRDASAQAEAAIHRARQSRPPGGGPRKLH